MLLIRIKINELDLLGAEDYYLTAKERLETVDGALGHSMWRGAHEPDSLLVIFEYRDVEAADKGLEALAGVTLLAQSQIADYHPAEVIRLPVSGRYGHRISHPPRPGFLSMSIRIADPGYGKELVNELEMIFQELSLIPGFCGSVYGSNETLDEEAIGIVTWENEAAFEASIPPTKRPYQVKLFERIY